MSVIGSVLSPVDIQDSPLQVSRPAPMEVTGKGQARPGQVKARQNGGQDCIDRVDFSN